MRIKLPVLQLYQPRRIELEIIHVNLLWRSNDFRFGRLCRSADFHVISIVLIDRVVAFPFSLCGFDPN